MMKAFFKTIGVVLGIPAGLFILLVILVLLGGCVAPRPFDCTPYATRADCERAYVEAQETRRIIRQEIRRARILSGDF